MSDFSDQRLSSSECVAFLKSQLELYIFSFAFTEPVFGAFLEMFTKCLTSRLLSVKRIPHLGTKKAFLLEMKSDGS